MIAFCRVTQGKLDLPAETSHYPACVPLPFVMMTPTQALTQILPAIRLRKAQALAAFLMVECQGRHRSEKIIDLLWQGSDAVRASASFRQVVRQVRLALAEGPQAGVDLQTGGGMVFLRLPPGHEPLSALCNDLADGTDGPAAQARLRSFLALLESLSGISPSFDSWLAIARAGLLAGARRLMDGQMARLPVDRAAALAEFAVELEPSNEIAVRFLMRADWREGRATRAIQRYNALYAHLDEGFDQEPEPETVNLLAAIKLNPAGGAAPPVPSDRPRIALCVTMKGSLGPGREAASLAAVLQADLRLRLGRFREWRVVDAAAGVAGAVEVRLNPTAAADGSLRLFVEVVRQAEGEVLWTEVIDRPERDWEGKVRLLLSHIANALSVVVAGRSLSDRAANVYDRWLKSQALLDDWSPETEGRALAMLREVTREAPRFGPAHAELAGALNVRHVLLPGTRQTEDVRQGALHHAIEAVSIDPLDTRAHRVLAWCYCHKGEFGLAEFHFEQALSLNRSNPLTIASAALGFAFTHNLAQAAGLAAEVRRHAGVMEPFHKIYLAAADYLCGNPESCARECRDGAGLMPTVGGWHTAALWQLGDRAGARARLETWCAEIAAQWHGPGQADPAAIIDWFCAIFPLREESVRDALRATLQAVARKG